MTDGHTHTHTHTHTYTHTYTHTHTSLARRYECQVVYGYISNIRREKHDFIAISSTKPVGVGGGVWSIKNNPLQGANAKIEFLGVEKMHYRA